MSTEARENEWEAWWDARVSAMQRLLGPAEGVVGHATVPFDIGAELGGGADVIYFKNHLPGVVMVTSELIGRDDQVLNSLGNYELAICTRSEEPWAGELISRLAYYTLEAKLEPGETMDVGAALPEGSSIEAFLFLDFGRFEVFERRAGILLCVGITGDELQSCHAGRGAEVERALRRTGAFPFTDLRRQSVSLEAKRWWKW